ncbi:DNA topoisomerase domain protein [Vibrio parahaemolyticus AQ3810]|nr:DNA topoisomerase domain protein [Vibrio parahaemolyticus AQ3810]
MSQVKSGPIPDSLRHLPKVERPAFKRKKRSYPNSGASKAGASKRKSS